MLSHRHILKTDLILRPALRRIIGELQEKLGISIPLDEAVELSGVRELLVCAEKCSARL